MKNIIKAIDFARKNKYDSAEYLGYWKGYYVYSPYFNDENICIIGLPIQILQKDDIFRMSTGEEAFEILDFFYKDK